MRQPPGRSSLAGRGTPPRAVDRHTWNRPPFEADCDQNGKLLVRAFAGRVASTMAAACLDALNPNPRRAVEPGVQGARGRRPMLETRPASARRHGLPEQRPKPQDVADPPYLRPRPWHGRSLAKGRDNTVMISVSAADPHAVGRGETPSRSGEVDRPAAAITVGLCNAEGAASGLRPVD
jgi:hypothetical protein